MPLQKTSVIVPIEELSRDKLHVAVLSYPKVDEILLTRRSKELQKLGVKALEFVGDKEVFGVPVLGKGCVGIVVAARIGHGKAALKVLRSDADRTHMLHEAQMLKKANSVQVGPLLIGYTRSVLLMQYVEGVLISNWFRRRFGEIRVKKVLVDLLEQCWRLDNAGLDHGELSHAPKHVIIDSADKPWIVDFETASLQRRTANVTSICQYLFISDLSAIVAEKIGDLDKKGIVEALRGYKTCKTRKNFCSVLTACGF
jgi:putative serine/threonine protein kinase